MTLGRLDCGRERVLGSSNLTLVYHGRFHYRASHPASDSEYILQGLFRSGIDCSKLSLIIIWW
jgi:hypothetical protein